jgi:hypothetical protein
MRVISGKCLDIPAGRLMAGAGWVLGGTTEGDSEITGKTERLSSRVPAARGCEDVSG